VFGRMEEEGEERSGSEEELLNVLIGSEVLTDDTLPLASEK
jgi:hypothetical protein